LRALDFGSGPFANYTVLTVHRDTTVTTETPQAFVSVSFPGFVGVITGVSQRGIGVSEKVWMTYNDAKKQSTDGLKQLQPGSYHGEPDVFVLRDILQ